MTTTISCQTKVLSYLDAEEPKTNVIEAYKKSSFCIKDPEYGFGTGTRPPLNSLTESGPGPGAYPLKSTLGKIFESNIKSPNQFSLKSRQLFGDPYARALSKTNANEPGPGQYDLNGKFMNSCEARKSSFPKARQPQSKSSMTPGPGSYEPISSMAKQVLSTKPDPLKTVFSKAERNSTITKYVLTAGTEDIGHQPYRSACEEQVDSRHPSCPTIKFGTGYRKRGHGDVNVVDLSEPSPGPGSYKLPGEISTRTRGTPYRNSPAPSISGRHKFGSLFG